MSSPQKIKGSKFERDAAKELSVNGGEWKRIPGSGSLGSNLKQPELMGDSTGRYPWWSKHFKSENKFGYGTSERLTVLREWITKNREQAKLDNKYSCLLLKFNNVTGGDIGSGKLICFNFDTWNEMMGELETLYNNYLQLLEREYSCSAKDDYVRDR